MTERVRDVLGAYNERVKLLATTVNALGIGIIAYGLLRPLIDNEGSAGPIAGLWGAAGLVLHVLSHYILKQISKGVDR